MSHCVKEDWDLCWQYLSPTGCRNLNCKWRHKNVGGRFQNYNTRAHCKGVNYSGDVRTKPGTPIYPRMQHQDGGFEDQFGLIHYPNMDKNDGCKKSFTSREQFGYKLEFENNSPILSPASALSSGMTSVLTSSDFASDSEGEMVNNAMLLSASSMFLDDIVGEFKTPKMNHRQADKASSSLSPFAKVFVPRINSVTSKDAISVGLSEMTLKNLSQFTSQQPANQKPYEIVDDKVYE